MNDDLKQELKEYLNKKAREKLTEILNKEIYTTDYNEDVGYFVKAINNFCVKINFDIGDLTIFINGIETEIFTNKEKADKLVLEKNIKLYADAIKDRKQYLKTIDKKVLEQKQKSKSLIANFEPKLKQWKKELNKNYKK